MIRFASLLWIWRSEAAGRWYFVTIPEELSAEIKAQSLGNPRGFGSVRVSASIGEISWSTSVYPLNSGGYVLPIKAEVRKRSGIAAGDEVDVTIDLLD